MWVSDSFRKPVLFKFVFKDDVNLRGSVLANATTMEPPRILISSQYIKSNIFQISRRQI